MMLMLIEYDENSVYVTFYTPEARKAIDAYLDYRRQYSEVIW